MTSIKCLTTAITALTLLVSAFISLADDNKPQVGSKPSTNVISQAADGSVKMLAKEAAIHGTTVRYEPQPHKNTIGYWTKADDWVSWDFQIHKPGSFTVELTQACGKGSGGSDYTLTIGTQTLTDKVPDTGSFTNFVNRKIGTVKLDKPGNYNVAVKPINKPGVAVMDLRAITLIPRPTD